VGCALTREQVIMAVDLTPRGTVGCCYYVARDEKLYFMEDIQFGEVDVVDARKYSRVCFYVCMRFLYAKFTLIVMVTSGEPTI
jgi:hypothetical protein